MRSNRNGLLAAVAEVWPENESLSTFICAATIVCMRVCSGAVSAWSDTTWKTVGMCTEPLAIRGASLITP